MSSMPARPPGIPAARTPSPQLTHTLVVWEMDIWDPESPDPEQTLVELLAGQAGGCATEEAQGLVVFGESETGSEAHVVQG